MRIQEFAKQISPAIYLTGSTNLLISHIPFHPIFYAEDKSPMGTGLSAALTSDDRADTFKKMVREAEPYFFRDAQFDQKENKHL